MEWWLVLAGMGVYGVLYFAIVCHVGWQAFRRTVFETADPLPKFAQLSEEAKWPQVRRDAEWLILQADHALSGL